MISALFILAWLGTACGASGPPLPATPKRPVFDSYHGERIEDDYRWLENSDDPEVVAWSEAENAYARSLLDALPSRPACQRRVADLYSRESPTYSDLIERRGRYFALKEKPPLQQPMLVVLDSLKPGGGERVVVDPNALDPSGGTGIDWFVPSPDGALVAVSMSQGGSEAGQGRVFQTATGRETTGDLIPRLNGGTAGGSLAWKGDGGGFWYTRYPAPGEVGAEDLDFFQRIYFHTLGTAAKDDVYWLGKELPRIAESFLQISEDGRYLLDLVEKGDGGEFELYLLDTRETTWRKLAGYEEQIVGVRFGPDDSLWLLSHKGAGRGRILRLAPGAASAAEAGLVVPEGAANVEDFVVTREALWVAGQLGGPSSLRRYGLKGEDRGEVSCLPISSISGLTRVGADSVLFRNPSYLDPSAWFTASGDGRVQKTSLAHQCPADLSGIEAQRSEAVSRDGTKIPFTILQPRGARRDGRNAVILTGYGGFSTPMTPWFSVENIPWWDQDGIIVVANLRGGSEFGETWHQAGWRTSRQNVYDDFLAVAERLIADRITCPERLALWGGSNGGLLVGAVLTQHPELFKAVVAEVGYFDMLRFESRPNGAFNTTEYGSVADPAQYRALRAYSPYHQVKDGVKYPPVIFLTGANDPRVDPMHSRKMVARLQAAGAVALLRTSGSTGHGYGTPLAETISQAVDIYSFLFDQLGVPYRTVP